MTTSPRGQRLHIAFFGPRNAGKSSLLNALVGQAVSIVSPVAGTTTDAVEKAMELKPLGPVVLLDTAGYDDGGELGEKRVGATRAVADRADVAIVALPPGPLDHATGLFLEGLRTRGTPVIFALTQNDLGPHHGQTLALIADLKLPAVSVSAKTGAGMDDLRKALVRAVPDAWFEPPSLVSDLLPPGGLCVLVVPIDKEAPKGRLIGPQVQTIRDLLDGDQTSLVVKERELAQALSRLKAPPDLVVTDSQAFLKVAADTPVGVPLTSFSILMARHKGDLDQFVAGAQAIDRLKPGVKILIAETCSHHPIGEDIGRVKIPRWLGQYLGFDPEVTICAGHDFPENLGDFGLVIQCGSCTTNRKEVLSRLWRCRQAGVAITNYGVAIAKVQGLLERVLSPFPSALETYRRALVAKPVGPKVG